MQEEDDKDRLFVTALARGLQVMAAFRPGESALSNLEIAKRTGLPKSTVSRLTYTLTTLGYLSQDEHSGFYRLGVALLALGSVVLASYDIRQVAGPLMREFALENNVSISLAMRDGTDMVYLETYRSQSRVSVQLTVGSRVPIATTAIGRAFMPDCRKMCASNWMANWPHAMANAGRNCSNGCNRRWRNTSAVATRHHSANTSRT
jgi:DNA-binding IclR family transcriptional regulator